MSGRESDCKPSAAAAAENQSPATTAATHLPSSPPPMECLLPPSASGSGSGGVLECPVCYEAIVRAPVYHCENGHAVCGDCHGRLVSLRRMTCPECRGRLHNKRNSAVEQILSRIRFVANCKFFPNCDVKLELHLMQKHELDCTQRTVTCFDCQDAVALPKLREHLEVSIHRRIRWSLSFGETKTKRCRLFSIDGDSSADTAWTVPIQIEEGTPEEKNLPEFYFTRILNHQPHSDGGQYMFWVSHNQTVTSHARSYQYTISLLCGKAFEDGKTVRLATFTGFCRPCASPLGPTSCHQRPFCFVVPEEVARESALENSCDYNVIQLQIVECSP